MIIDFHSHILPGIDDGSRNAAIALKMLEEEARQGVMAVFATPHFYPSRVDLGHFLFEREEALKKIHELAEKENKKDLPEIILGAEVAYFSGISRSNHLSEICIPGTKMILIEMPFDSWSSQIIWEIKDLASFGYIPIIAHVERYLDFDKNEGFVHELAETAIFQFNASTMEGYFERKPIFRMLRHGYAMVLGTDAHNLDSRPPILEKAREIIEKKIGQEYLDGIDELSGDLTWDLIKKQK